MLLEITRLPFSAPPPATNVICTISHSVGGGPFIIDSTNIVVQPDGFLVQPYDLNIAAPGGTTITVRAKSNCGTQFVQKDILVPADPATTTTTTTGGTTTTTTAGTTTTTTTAATTTTTTTVAT